MKKNSMAPVKDGSPTVRVVCSTVSLFPTGEPQPPSNGWVMQINAGYNQPQVDSYQESDVFDDDYEIPGRRFEVDRGETRLNPSNGGLDRQLNAGYDQPDVSEESENVYIDPVIPVDVNRGKVGTHQYANGTGDGVHRRIRQPVCDRPNYELHRYELCTQEEEIVKLLSTFGPGLSADSRWPINIADLFSTIICFYLCYDIDE